VHSKAWLTLETLTALKSENHVPAQDFCLVQCVEIVQPNHWTIELLLLVVICCWRRNCAWSLVHLGCNWLNEAPRGALGSRWFKVERCQESLSFSMPLGHGMTITMITRSTCKNLRREKNLAKIIPKCLSLGFQLGWSCFCCTSAHRKCSWWRENYQMIGIPRDVPVVPSIPNYSNKVLNKTLEILIEIFCLANPLLLWFQQSPTGISSAMRAMTAMTCRVLPQLRLWQGRKSHSLDHTRTMVRPWSRISEGFRRSQKVSTSDLFSVPKLFSSLFFLNSGFGTSLAPRVKGSVPELLACNLSSALANLKAGAGQLLVHSTSHT